MVIRTLRSFVARRAAGGKVDDKRCTAAFRRAAHRRRRCIVLRGGFAGIGATFPAIPTPMSDPYRARLLARIEELAAEHRDLDRLLEAVLAEAPVDQIRVRRLKKRKLLLKDQIALLRRELDPDVSA
ncbi:MAG: DUF465 domain-containing protein [Betaproteobacteria bacterium]|nr:DUF465 domain-containing protein [Betaproteobacteria bacterium]